MEERISDLEDRNLEMIQVEKKKELRFWKSEQTLWEYQSALGEPT